MRLSFSILLITAILTSCTKPTGVTLPLKSTYKVEKTDTKEAIIEKAAHVVPTKNQFEALQDEYIAFIHFGPNTFTRMEWGNGMEDPKIFDLKNLDTDQWCKAMKASGMTKVVLTVKHHDGFCIWQTRYTKHGIMSTNFRNGKGDVLRDLTNSCKKYGLKLGVYLSPADLYQIENKDGLYGNLSKKTERVIPRKVEGRPFKNKTTFKFKVDDYNEYCLNQLFELLTEYGDIHEVWFDGAHPKRKGGQQYDYMAWKKLIKTLAPKAVIFGRQDIRWCGNEAGKTRKTEWNIIPYAKDPAKMNRFPDITGEVIADKSRLYKANYLHYQFAETNTSIREGWFYRDDTDQKVRSTDDVFDIYERSVGGNSVFLLNIPPNREGKFSPQDVKVLNEVGERIRKTYSKNLFAGAKGEKNLLDDDITSCYVLNDKSFTITTPNKVTINRIAIQEAIQTHGERVSAFSVEAFVDNKWKTISTSTNIGYKRIVRFPVVTSDKFRFTLKESRALPAISNITAHYYETRPPQLSITRDKKGEVKISPKKSNFQWKSHGQNAASNLNSGIEIRYTTDGSTPGKESALYKKPFTFKSGEIKAIAFNKDKKGSVASNIFGIVKNDWKLLGVDSQVGRNKGAKAFDGNPTSYWQSKGGKSHSIAIDLGKEYTLKGFSYTPQTRHSRGMIENGIIKISSNGKSWKTFEKFKIGNLINDPTTRRHFFKKSVKTRYIKVESTIIAGGDNSAAIAEIGFLE